MHNLLVNSEGFLLVTVHCQYPADTVEYLIGHQEYNLFRGHELWKETDPGYRTEKSDPGVIFMTRLREQLKTLELQGPPGNTE